MAYDPKRARVVLFGGSGGDGGSWDTWEWDGVRWTELSPSVAPDAPGWRGMAYDVKRARMVFFGGGDTWEWDGERWTEYHPPLSPPSAGYAMAYDAARARVILFGSAGSDTWEWDGAHWTAVSPPTSPPVGAKAAYDAARGNVVLIGGFAGSYLDDTWLTRYRVRTLPDESCRFGVDTDGDSLIGCNDPDCWAYCTPSCPPGAACDLTAPHCGDGVCNEHLETYRFCPQDCAPDPVCGDFFCDPGETNTSCPGDCAA